MKTISFIFQYLKKHKLRYAAGILTLFIVDFANLFIPKLTGTITDGLTARTLDWQGIKLCLLAILLLGALLSLGRFLWRYFLFGASRSNRAGNPQRFCCPSGTDGRGILQRTGNRRSDDGTLQVIECRAHVDRTCGHLRV